MASDWSIPYLWTAIAAFIPASIIFVLYSPRLRTITSHIAMVTVNASSSSMSNSVGIEVCLNMPPEPGDLHEHDFARVLSFEILNGNYLGWLKSCKGISVQSAKYTPEGLENDRLWSIIDAEKVTVITARVMPQMVLITPTIGKDGTLKVSFPEGSGCDPFSIPLQPTDDILKTWTFLPKITLWPTHEPVDGYICQSVAGYHGSPSAILSKFLKKPVHLVFKGPNPRLIDPTTSFPDLKATAKYQDMYPLLVLSEESTKLVDAEVQSRIGTQGINEWWRGENVVIERFRPNIVFKGGGPFAEDQWEKLCIGSEGAPSITMVSKCTRCLLPNVNPQTGERDEAVPFKVLMKFRTGLDPTHKLKPCVGCNGVPDGDGVITVGDRVYIKKLTKSVQDI